MYLLTKENVALFISILSISITLYSFLRKIYHERVDVSTTAHSSRVPGDNKNVALDLSFVNNARLPVTINKIELVIRNNVSEVKGVAPGKREKFIVHKTNKEITDVTMFQEVPFTLTAKGSLRGWFRFEFKNLAITKNIHTADSELFFYCHNKIKKVKIDVPKEQPII